MGANAAHARRGAGANRRRANAGQARGERGSHGQGGRPGRARRGRSRGEATSEPGVGHAARQQGADSQPTWRPDARTVQEAVHAAVALEKLPPGDAALAAHAEAEASAAAVQQATTGGGGDEDLAGFTEMVGNQGGLTALLLAVRDGHAGNRARAARRRRRHQPGDTGRQDESAAPGEHQRPLRSREDAHRARRQPESRQRARARRRSTR